MPCFVNQALCLALIVTAPLAVCAQDKGAILERLNANYNAGTALQADFDFSASSEYWSEPQELTGQLLLDGDRFRVETGSDVFVVAGGISTLYRREENQVLISQMGGGADFLTPGSLLADIGAHYNVVRVEEVAYEAALHDAIHLAPRSSDVPARDLTVWLRRRDGIVTRIESADAGGTRVTVTFDRVRLNPGIREDAFTFTPPGGAEIIDMRF